MTPLEAARRMIMVEPLGLQPAQYADGDMHVCHWCENEQMRWIEKPFEHKPDCPWLMMSQIVAELEDLERIRQRTYAAALAKAQAGTLDCSTDVEGLTR